MNISRRSFIKGGVVLSSLPLTLSLSGCTFSESPFSHGVASGDPLDDRVILWTRITIPKEISDKVDLEALSVKVIWQVASDTSFSSIVASGHVITSQENDFTVKADATGLRENTRYFYRFIVDELEKPLISPVGKTKTLPRYDVSKIKLAMASCSHFSYGYFNVYARIAEIPDLDAVLHLGDYLYEYGNKDIYRNPFLWNRKVVPAHEMVSLSDYRQRHACYKTDEDLQTLHQTHPMICIWDDHEFTNDTWQGGAENHNAGEGTWQARSQAAIQAYYEWMPIREPNSHSREKAYRRFKFGDLAELNMLDTRFVGRDQQVEVNDPARLEAQRTLLGYEQEQWLQDNLFDAKRQGVKWKLLGQQVQMMQIQMLGKPINTDAWDGYPAARTRLLDFIEANNIDNVIVLTGDVHSSWAANICKDPYDWRKYNRFTHDGALAVEIVTSSVTSPSIPVPGLQQLVGDVGKILMPENPHIRYVDLANRGFVTLDINSERLTANWHHVPFVGFKNDQVHIGKQFTVYAGKAKLQ
ncbi:alkaline phosphatase D family protein [Pseudoalteromonas luteoviolacea]|uniref:alkaline phosphatase D family protein n=1 Tax=Pseudoalteromonas luteoviolacea TaxID=43657 RepID=UPI001B36A4A1|nr:alkaline phosphatase D family protein [Pseudoalteromonas luteoviolacea]MBQ4813243.1 alkaline phosphatase D family protein [Pseudoalteromonas luteoviolacea]